VTADGKLRRRSRGFCTPGVGLLAMVSIMSAVVAAVAGDNPSQANSRLRDVSQSEQIIRPPALIPSFRRHAVANPRASSTDRYAAEFLRWKEQHSNPRR
jgi:hypothetical protein